MDVSPIKNCGQQQKWPDSEDDDEDKVRERMAKMTSWGETSKGQNILIPE